MKIGIIDSGIGGLATIRDIASTAKGVKFYYVCDRKNLPYGNKSVAELIAITGKNISYIEGFCPDKLIFACNTLSTTCFEYFKDKYPFEILPVLPPLSRKKGKTLLLATPNTVKNIRVDSGAFVLALPHLAGMIEEDAPDIKRAVEVLETINLAAFDTIILGCTHYRYLKEYLENEYQGLNVIDGIEDVTERIVKEGISKGVENEIYYKVTDGTEIKEVLFGEIKHTGF